MNNKFIRYFFIAFTLVIICSCSSEFSKKSYTLNLSKSLIYKNAGGAKVKLYSPDYVNGEVGVFEDKDNIFIVSASNAVIKMSLKERKIIWKQKIASIPQKNLSFDEKYIYFTSVDNKFYILNYETGKTEFIYYTYSSDRSLMNNVRPIVYKNNIVVVFGNGETVIFNKTNRKVLKKLPKKEILDDSVTVENGILKMNNTDVLNLNNFK